MPVPCRRSPLSCWVLLALVLAVGLHQVLSCEGSGSSVCGARQDGDVMLGILMTCHNEVKQDRWKPPSTCRGLNVFTLLKSLAVIHTIEEVNAAGFLPGVSLGYYMCDTCSNPTRALKNVEHMLAVNGSLDVSCDKLQTFRPQIKAIIGATTSEVSIAVAKLLSVHMVPQVSYSSSSPALSDKFRYPSFLRTIPSDVHQTKAMAQLMAYYNWTWVGVVYEDNDYGTAAFQSLLRDATELGVCFAYQEVVPHHQGLIPESIRRVEQLIRSTPTAQVVILILTSNIVELLFTEMIRSGTSRTWIASDSWSSNRLLGKLEGIQKVGDIFGLRFVSQASKSFDSWLQQLRPPGHGSYNRFIEEYKNLRFKCTPECFAERPPPHCSEEELKLKSPNACDYQDPQEANDDFLVTALDTSDVYSARQAVWAVAHALRSLLDCNATRCSGETDLLPWMLLEHLRNISFELDNTTVFFDDSGDFVNGYDVITWVVDEAKTIFRKIGRYYAMDDRIDLDESGIVWYSGVPAESRCSPTCVPGTIKKFLDHSCCYNCTECLEGNFANSSDLSTCDRCAEGTWSSKGAMYCRPRRHVFLQWTDAYPVALLAAAAAGLLLLLTVFVVFMVHREAPPMRRAEVRLSCVMMAGLAASFVSVVCYVGKPNTHLCRARQVLYALGFTLCVACILVKAFRTFVAFLPFGQLTHRWLYRLYNPPAVVLAVTSLQGLICILWLVFDSPDVHLPVPTVHSMEQHFQCHQGSDIGFGVMLGYIALLALAGFLLAFKGRKVPQEFSETGYIIFSMLMYLFVWICYISVYILKRDPSAIVQASAILVSSYGIIFCHFLPKCYEALWRVNGDTVEKILRKWRVISDRGSTFRSTHTTSPAAVDPESGGNRQPPHAVARAGTVGPYRPTGFEEFKTPGIIGNTGDILPVGGPLSLIPRRRIMKSASL